MSEIGSLTVLLQALRARPFAAWSYEEKCAAKNRRPTPHLDVKIVDGKQNRKFQDSWYSKYPWLTGCARSKNLFCYVCILFGGETKWTLHGIAVTKNFVRKAEKHQNSRKHLQNYQNYCLLGRWMIADDGEASPQQFLLSSYVAIINVESNGTIIIVTHYQLSVLLFAFCVMRSCTMESFIIFTHHQILLGRSNQGE
jgi:hypothetical protein